MEGDDPSSTIEILTPPKKSIEPPEPIKPKSKTPITPIKSVPKKPITPKKPIIKKPLIKPKSIPHKIPKKPTPIKPPIKTKSIPSLPTGQPKPIPKIWWLWLVIGIIAIILAIGTLIMIGNNPFDTNNITTKNTTSPTKSDSSSTITELKIFTCEEIIKINKEIIDNSCDENALFEIVGGIDYITVIHSNSTKSACINGPTEIINYIKNTCGNDSVEIIKSLKILDPILIK